MYCLIKPTPTSLTFHSNKADRLTTDDGNTNGSGVPKESSCARDWMGVFLQEGAGCQSSKILYQASRGRSVNGRGAFLLVTSQLIVKMALIPSF